MSEAIREFVERLKDIRNNFVQKEYDYKAYNTEIAHYIALAKDTSKQQELLAFCQKIFENQYFELHHPEKPSILTRAVYSTTVDYTMAWYGNCVFFTDKHNSNPWVLIQIYEFFQVVITENCFFYSPLSLGWFRQDSNNGICYRLPRTINFHYNKILDSFFYKDIKFAWRLDKFRPSHYFMECLPGLLLQHLKKPYLPKSFFIPKFLDKSLKADSANYIGVYPNFFRFTPLDQQARDLANKNIVDESLNGFNTLVDPQDKLDKFDKEYITSQEINALLSCQKKEI